MVEESGTFEVLEQRKFNGRLSLMLAIVGATAALFLIVVDHKTPLFFGKGSDMGPILIASGAFIAVVNLVMLLPRFTRNIGAQGRTTAYVVVGLLELAVLLSGLTLFG